MIKIIYPDSTKFGDKLHRYTVITEDGEQFEIDNRELFVLRQNTPDQILFDFNEKVGTLESLISYFREMELKVKDAINKHESEEYANIKALPKSLVYNREFNSKTEGDKEVSDRFAAAYIQSDTDYLNLKESVSLMSVILTRLEASLRIARNTWETARSLNSNSRSLIGIK